MKKNRSLNRGRTGFTLTAAWDRPWRKLWWPRNKTSLGYWYENEATTQWNQPAEHDRLIWMCIRFGRDSSFRGERASQGHIRANVSEIPFCTAIRVLILAQTIILGRISVVGPDSSEWVDSVYLMVQLKIMFKVVAYGGHAKEFYELVMLMGRKNKTE